MTGAPPAQDSYYGRPILKEPVWTWEIPTYFFVGGLAGASSTLSLAARAVGNERLARAALLVAVAGEAVSPALLVSDLGRPRRFLNMLRVFKVTSPMSVGSWVLAGSGTASAVALASGTTGRLPRLGLVAEGVSALLGPILASYTGVLVADTAIPVWHEGRRELPVVFAGSAAASAGAAALLLVPPAEAGPARRLLLAGAAIEGAGMQLMERRLGFVGEPYRQGTAGRLARLAKGLTAAGALVTAVAGRRRAGAAAGGALVLTGELALRWSIFKAGFQSARDPRYTVAPQKARLAARAG
jgi:hypothetical protein